MWDDQIDDVARRLTEGKAGADWSVRVAARIASAPLHRAHWGPLTLSAMGIMAIVLLAWVVIRPGPDAEPPRVVANAPARSAPPNVAETGSVPAPRGRAAITKQEKPLEPNLGVNRLRELIAPDGFSIADPIVFESLAFPSLAQETPVVPLSPVPLEVETLEISPLTDQTLDQE